MSGHLREQWASLTATSVKPLVCSPCQRSGGGKIECRSCGRQVCKHYCSGITTPDGGQYDPFRDARPDRLLATCQPCRVKGASLFGLPPAQEAQARAIHDEFSSEIQRGVCGRVSAEVERRLGYPREQGFFVGGGLWVLHSWNLLPDGRVLDVTADQFGRDGLVFDHADYQPFTPAQRRFREQYREEHLGREPDAEDFALGVEASLTASTLYHGTGQDLPAGTALKVGPGNYAPEAYHRPGIYVTDAMDMAFFYAVFGPFSAADFSASPHVYEVEVTDPVPARSGEWTVASAVVTREVTGEAKAAFRRDWESVWKPMILDTPTSGFPTPAMIVREFEARIR